jgi:glycosyltransferase involved in cell wall biosynthesis
LKNIEYIKTKNFEGNSIGGAIGHTIGMANGFFKTDSQAIFITDVHLKKVLAEQIIVSRGKLKGNFLFDLISNRKYYKNIINYMKNRNPKFIYHRHVLFCDIGIRLKQKFKIPFVLEYNSSEIKKWTHNTTIINPKNIFKRLAFRLMKRFIIIFCKDWENNLLTDADMIVVVSEVLKKELIQEGIDEKKIVIQPNGVDCNFFKNSIKNRNRVRDKYCFKSNDVVIGFSGTFGNWHGIPELTEAIKNIASISGIGFLLIGEGALKKDMQKQLINFQNVQFLGKIAYENMPEYLSACDILVVANSWKNKEGDFFGSPTKLFEYMAMEKAIVASNLGQISQILTHNENALLFEAGNTKALTSALIELINDSELRTRIAVRARKKALESFTWDIATKNILEKFDNMEGKYETSSLK